MAIEKGRDWGKPVVPAALVPAESDADVVLLQGEHAPFPSAGHLHRALGGPELRAPRNSFTELTVDALVCTVVHGTVEREVVACADVAVGSWFGRDGFLLLTNVGTWRDLDVTPGSHPNDGRFEMLRLDARMSPRDRFVARRRARTGVHLPHPLVSVGHARDTTVERRGRQRLVIDSVDAGEWTSVRVSISPDRLRVTV